MIRLARCTAVLAVVFLCTGINAQDDKKPRRFGFDVDQDTYPQKTPAEAMNSIAKAIDRKRVDYMLAHMADPGYVDYWVDQYKGEFTEGKEEGKRLLAFYRLVRETNQYFANDPLIVKDLQVFGYGKFAQEAKLSKLVEDKNWPKDTETLLHGKFVEVQLDGFRISTRKGDVRFHRTDRLAITDDGQAVEWGKDMKLHIGKLMAVTFQDGAKWTENSDVATGEVEPIPARKVFLKKVGDRWFLMNKQEEPKAKEPMK